jgi:N-acetylglucosaminyl-diphospho-decaprenol L-rhamnosyltransferase
MMRISAPAGPAGAAGEFPAVSALIVNYRAYAELHDCLASLEQQRPRIEVVVVDQQSVPHERQRLELEYPEVRWLPLTTNTGFSAGVNLASRHASGALLYLVNPDAVVDAGTPAALAGYLAAHPDVAVVGSRVRDPDGGTQGSARRFPGLSTLFGGRRSLLTRLLPGNPVTRRNVVTGDHVVEPIRVDWVSGASLMVTREAFAEVGGMDERFFLYWEDADLCKRLSDRGRATAYYPAAAITHLVGRSSRKSARSVIAFHRSAYRYFHKHAGGAARLARPLVWLVLAARAGVTLLAGAVARSVGR